MIRRGPLTEDEAVIFIDRKEREYLRRLEPGRRITIRGGTIAPEDVISREEGTVVRSALNEAFFQVGPSPIGPGDLALSELNCDLSGKGAEFVELANLSSRAINLRGARFEDGITYSFADNRDTVLGPGQRLVLVVRDEKRRHVALFM